MKKLKLVYKNHFYFRGEKGWARLHLRKTATNRFIITLTDLRDKVIFCCTPGLVRSTLRTKKMRKSPYSVEAMFPKVLLYLRFYKIKVVDVLIKMKLRAHIFFLFKELKLRGIHIFRIFEMYGVPHNGVRSRKVQRK